MEVEDYTNLAKVDEGSIITVNLHPANLTANNLEKGKHFSGTVRKVSGHQYFMEEGGEGDDKTV